MARSIDCSLLAEGSSDIVLLPILDWLLREHSGDTIVNCVWADLRRLPKKVTALQDRIVHAVILYPCDVLFVHRDADANKPEIRYKEIATAADQAKKYGFNIPHVCVVPVRMQEAWLLLEEAPIRRAAGNPNGRDPIGIPPKNRIETLPDPKETLYALLKQASGLRGGRLKKFHPPKHAARVTEYIRDFTGLRSLEAFQRLEHDVINLMPDLCA